MQTSAIAAQVFGSGAAYGMGWITGPVGGIPAVWHDGITGAFHTDLIIEPQHSRGAILLFNSFTVLAQGAYEQIEAGVARLLAAQEPTPAGLSLSAFYLLVESILALLSLCALCVDTTPESLDTTARTVSTISYSPCEWETVSGSWSSLSWSCLVYPHSQVLDGLDFSTTSKTSPSGCL